MRRAYSITYGRGPPVVRRGNLEPVRLTLAQRMGNKKVTLIDNLEVYGIPAADVAHSLQKVAAASTTGTYVYMYVLFIGDGCNLLCLSCDLLKQNFVRRDNFICSKVL